MTKTLYIAGPMTGLPEYNYPAFNEAAEKLRAAGYTVLNPAENGEPEHFPGRKWTDWMRLAIAQLIQADGVCVLEDWHHSVGAAFEVHIATRLDMQHNGIIYWLNRAHLEWETANPLRPGGQA